MLLTQLDYMDDAGIAVVKKDIRFFGIRSFQVGTAKAAET